MRIWPAYMYRDSGLTGRPLARTMLVVIRQACYETHVDQSDLDFVVRDGLIGLLGTTGSVRRSVRSSPFC